jgi:hypothetical protein
MLETLETPPFVDPSVKQVHQDQLGIKVQMETEELQALYGDPQVIEVRSGSLDQLDPQDLPVPLDFVHPCQHKAHSVQPVHRALFCDSRLELLDRQVQQEIVDLMRQDPLEQQRGLGPRAQPVQPGPPEFVEV